MSEEPSEIDSGRRGSADLALRTRAMEAKNSAAHQPAATTDERNCDHCGASETYGLPEGHRLADEFDVLCADCAGMDVCTRDGCDAAFFDWGARAKHIRHVHDNGWDGDHRCNHCGEMVTPSAITSDDPRMGGRTVHGRRTYICPACGHGLRGVARDAGRLI